MQAVRKWLPPFSGLHLLPRGAIWPPFGTVVASQDPVGQDPAEQWRAPLAWRVVGRRGGGCEHRIHERIAPEGHRPLQLSAEVFGGAFIAAVQHFEPLAFQQSSAGLGQAQRPFLVAGVGHQVGRQRALAEPCRDHRDKIKATLLLDQTHKASEQIQHLPLRDLGDAAAKAGVANAACPEFMAASQQWYPAF